MINNSKIKNQKSKLHQGFTLIEVIVATAVFAFFLGSVIAAMIANAHNGPVNQRRLQAANLAREGTQLVTQIRDTAWIKGWDWASLGAPSGQRLRCWGLSQAQSKVLEYPSPPSIFPGQCQFFHWRLVNDNSGTGETINTIFTRRISITNQTLFSQPNSNAKLITVTVEWTEGGETKNVEMKKLITDWKAI